MMRSDLAVSLVAGVLLILLVLRPRGWWRGGKTAPATPKPTRRQREPKPVAVAARGVGRDGPGLSAHPGGGRGERPLSVAQRLVQQVTQVLLADCLPLVLTDGLCASLTALVSPDGRWMHPERRQAHGPRPKPRWMPQPPRLYAQGSKS